MKFSKTTYLDCFVTMQEARVFAENRGVFFGTDYDSDVWTTLCRMLLAAGRRRTTTLRGI